ncbi:MULTISPECIES: NAD(P)H-dependent oxidoreductase [unclassified Streptomyces]|uniref:NAD(P)H-dependent oxidoreductase n=1 Tax=unclassified Streptomyces TaxID=2593676 RepID=UPI002E20F9F5|nr:NAD(P)H-dependent oxidoreductase [Streptomyces sp. NBC_01023]
MVHHIAMVSGSIRHVSLNRKLLSVAESVAENRPNKVRAEFLDIHNLPFYDGDRETENTPAEVLEAKRFVSSCDGLVIATPEYNGAPPGVLQNALDWLSRPWGNSPLTGKPVVTLSASPGPGGARAAQDRLRQILIRCGAQPTGEPFSVPCADWLCNPELTGTGSALAGHLADLLDTLLSARSPAPSGRPVRQWRRPPAPEEALG